MLWLQIDCKSISCMMTAPFINAFCEPIAHAQKKPVYISIWNGLPLFNQLVIWQLGKDTSHIPSSLEYPRDVRLGIYPGIWMAILQCWHDHYNRLANTSLPYCRYWSGIFVLEENIVSNSLIDWQDMRVKDFIHIALAYKWASSYMYAK